MATYVKFKYNEKSKTIALYKGINFEEIIKVLKAVFNVTGNIVGIKDEREVITQQTLFCFSKTEV